MLGSVPAPEFVPLLHYWFGDLTHGLADADHRKRWFSGGAEFDAELSDRFAHLVEGALRGDLVDWHHSTRGCLAYVLVCDQLTRNIFRGKRHAYAGDARALDTARDAVARGVDVDLALDERAFLYMPFEHSENLADQNTCVGLFSELSEQIGKIRPDMAEGFLNYAVGHREIIRRYGRFPHRNAVLGRQSTDDEQRYLATASGFGQ